MKSNSRIRFSPVTKEIEIEGSESFVKTYFDKLQAMISEPLQESVPAKRASRAGKAAPEKKAGKAPNAVKPAIPGKAKHTGKMAPTEKRVTNIDAVVALIQGSADGISTTELKDKTGLAERQIWSIVNRAAKQGKIKKMKRGLYGPVAETRD